MTYLDILYFCAAPLFAPYFIYKTAVRGKYRESSRNMLGIGLQRRFAGKSFDKTIWIHAVSVGEVVAAKPIFNLLRSDYPDYQIVVSTITETGQKMARGQLGDADAIFFFPVDVSAIVRKFLNLFRPKIFITMETELWPNFLALAQKSGVKTFLVNGKISSSSFKKYKRFRFLFRSAFANMSAYCMQTEQDAQRVRELSGDDSKVFVTGNCKFDSSPALLDETERKNILKGLRIDPDRPVIIAGSTHTGEEKIILEAFMKCRQTIGNLALILAPRHPERFDAVFEALGKLDLRISRNSAPDVDNPDVVLLDTIGVLARYYGLAKLAIVGGSFVPVGGHNLLEAAAHGIPVIYGKYMHRQPEITKIINSNNGGIESTGDGLAEALLELLGDEAKRAEMGRLAKNASTQNRGSAGKCVEIIMKCLDS